MKNNEKKKKIFVSAILFGLALNLVGMVRGASAWGPERTTYTNESPAPAAVFNSITNNAAVGDERDFVRIVEVRSDGVHDNYVDSLNISGGKEYEVYIYYHNDASATYNTKEYEYRGVAWETKLSVNLPEQLKAGEDGTVYAKISAEKTLVPEVWDDAHIVATEDVKISYVNGSAKIYNKGKVNASVLSTNLFTNAGTYIGHNNLDGLILGCDEFSGQVMFRFVTEKIETEEPTPTEPSSGFTIDKKATKDNGSSWMDDVEAGAGETVGFKIVYINTGTVAQRDVTVFDTLEGLNGAEYVKGSTKIVRGGTETAVEDGAEGLFNGGLKIGEVQPGETVEIFYNVKLAEIKTFDCGKTTLNNLAGVSSRRADDENSGVATKYDKVQITVNREGGDCLPAELPQTGPAQIVLATIVCMGIIGGAGYYFYSKAKLKKLQKEAKGETGETIEKTPEM